MSKRLRVGNLDPQVGDAELIELFSAHGSVGNAWVVLDRETKQSRCFGFVDMTTEEGARAVIAALDRKPLLGKVLHVELLTDPGRPPSPWGGPRRMGPPGRPGNFSNGPRGGFPPRGPGGPRFGPRGPEGFGRGRPPGGRGPGR